MYQGDGSGADGMCMHYGASVSTDIAYSGAASDGLSLCFDSYQSDHGVKIGWNGDTIFSEVGLEYWGYSVSLFEDSAWHDVIVTVTPKGSGAIVALNFDNYYYYKTAWVNGYSTPIGNGLLSFAARTGGSTNNHYARNVQVCAEATPTHAPTPAPTPIQAPTPAPTPVQDNGFLDLNFEYSTSGTCPLGWTCTGGAQVLGTDPDNDDAILSGMEGSSYFYMGSDSDVGSATSVPFVLPAGISKITFLRAGGANPPSGLYVYDMDDNLICKGRDGTNTNEFFDHQCMDSLASYEGEIAQLYLEDSMSAGWGRLLVDDINFVDANGVALPITQAPETWYEVILGSCTASNGCARSPNYPENYSNNDWCIITLASYYSNNGAAGVHLLPTSFSTEEGHDRLYVNGEEYSGTDFPDGVDVTNSIMWSSDNSSTSGGWEFCQ
jgi:hypothetical protein